MILRGQRCALRPWASGDLGSLVRHADNINVARYLRDRFPHPYTRRHGRAFLAMAARSADGSTLAIEVDGEAVGGIGVRVGDDVERFSGEIGYWLGEPFWGRGVVTEALGLFSADVFDRLNLLRLFALPVAGNGASARVLEKAGYQREGLLRAAAVKFGRPHDQLMYALINPRWRGAGVG